MKTVSKLLCIVFFAGISISFTFAYSDVAGHKYESSITFITQRGVVKGYDDGTYRPDAAVSRAELMKIILEGVQANMGSGVNCFPDVADQRYSKYICYGKLIGLIKGYTDGTFKPEQKVTVAEGLKITLNGFAMDIAEGNGSKWYQPFMDFVHNNNIFSKYAIIPSRQMTRGEMAFLVYKLMLNKDGALTFDNVRDVVASPGCGKTPPSPVLTQSYVAGMTRHYITVIGNRYDKNTPMKLIIAFHGRTNSNAQVQQYYDIDEESEGNAIIVYPSGLPEATSPRNRSNGGDRSDQLRDFALFDKIVEDMSEKYCIDMDRIFVVGHSLGAWFTNSLSCARGDVIRAIGSVGGGTTINDCAGPVAVVIMHNPLDNLATFRSGETARDQLLRQNSCDTSHSTPVGPAGGNCVQYECQDGATTIRCPHSDNINEMGNYYPHTRPDFAGAYIYDFLDSQG